MTERNMWLRHAEGTANQLIDWLIDWFIGWFFIYSMDRIIRLIDWLEALVTG